MRIGITANIKHEDSGPLIHQKISYIVNEYISAVSETGAVPYLLPIVEDENLIMAQLDCLDGLILPGGADVNPALYGEEFSPLLGTLMSKKGLYEKKILELAAKLDLPVLGICRGCQMINIFFGGTLYQDISLAKEKYIKHWQNRLCDDSFHTAELKKGSWLHSIYGNRIIVNSYHHQVVNKVAEGFEVSAKSSDNLVEAIEKVDDQFFVGVQWHPEMMNDRRIFENFTKVCKERKSRVNNLILGRKAS
ncbi:MAG: gamma-glutamyl-gamma-aminobutyrate hydrolase family protein [bacterium]|nr:gamma-glutamyl-gamma-aminobutyrate hydrolase family protein [bacterium]